MLNSGSVREHMAMLAVSEVSSDIAKLREDLDVSRLEILEKDKAVVNTIRQTSVDCGAALFEVVDMINDLKKQVDTMLVWKQQSLELARKLERVILQRNELQDQLSEEKLKKTSLEKALAKGIRFSKTFTSKWCLSSLVNRRSGRLKRKAMLAWIVWVWRRRRKMLLRDSLDVGYHLDGSDESSCFGESRNDYEEGTCLDVVRERKPGKKDVRQLLKLGMQFDQDSESKLVVVSRVVLDHPAVVRGSVRVGDTLLRVNDVDVLTTLGSNHDHHDDFDIFRLMGDQDTTTLELWRQDGNCVKVVIKNVDEGNLPLFVLSDVNPVLADSDIHYTFKGMIDNISPIKNKEQQQQKVEDGEAQQMVLQQLQESVKMAEEQHRIAEEERMQRLKEEEAYAAELKHLKEENERLKRQKEEEEERRIKAEEEWEIQRIRLEKEKEEARERDRVKAQMDVQRDVAMKKQREEEEEENIKAEREIEQVVRKREEERKKEEEERKQKEVIVEDHVLDKVAEEESDVDSTNVRKEPKPEEPAEDKETRKLVFEKTKQQLFAPSKQFQTRDPTVRRNSVFAVVSAFQGGQGNSKDDATARSQEESRRRAEEAARKRHEEEKRKKQQELDMRKKIEEEKREKELKEESEKNKQQEDAQRMKRQKEEEAEKRRKEQEEAEKKRKEAEEADNRKRGQHDNIDRNKEQEEAERRKREQEEAERRKREQEEAERKKKEQEEAERRKREQEEAERKKREQDEAERKKKEQEESERRKREQEEAERKKKEQEEAERKKKEQEEAERKKREQEEAERRKREQEEAERKKKEQEEAERKKKEQEEAERGKREHEEAERKKKEQEEAERKKKEQEEAAQRQATTTSTSSQDSEVDDWNSRLSDGWKAIRDPNKGKIYFYHKEKKLTQWKPPDDTRPATTTTTPSSPPVATASPTTSANEDAELEKANADLPSGWKATRDKTSGRIFFFNRTLGETTWVKPQQQPQQQAAVVQSPPSSIQSPPSSIQSPPSSIQSPPSAIQSPPSSIQSPAAATPTEDMDDSDLPEGWKAAFDKSKGKVYYFHRATGKSSWVKPQKETTSALPEGWKQSTDPKSGKVFYYNKALNKTSWEKPTA